MTIVDNVEDMRRAAQRLLPRQFFDYVDGGSWREGTRQDNEKDLDALFLRQRVGIDVSDRHASSPILGREAQMPIVLAPTGLAGLLYPDGEIAAARAAEAAGVPYVLPTMSICPIEAVRAAVSKPFWFQLYMLRDRNVVRALIDRARAAECSALILTMDLPAHGRRHKDVHNGLSVPLRVDLRHLVSMLRHPTWCLRMARARHRKFGNIAPLVPDADGAMSLAHWTAQQFDPSLTWRDIEWIKRHWEGKLVIKGILDPRDAKLATEAGCDGLVVSNHGGRQLDGAVSSIRALQEIVPVVPNGTEIHMDGGIRSGLDVVKALALGAKAVYIGRPFLYGLAVGGERGVAQCLEFFRRDIDLAMAFCGVNRISDLHAGTVTRV